LRRMLRDVAPSGLYFYFFQDLRRMLRDVAPSGL